MSPPIVKQAVKLEQELLAKDGIAVYSLQSMATFQSMLIINNRRKRIGLALFPRNGNNIHSDVFWTSGDLKSK